MVHVLPALPMCFVAIQQLPLSVWMDIMLHRPLMCHAHHARLGRIALVAPRLFATLGHTVQPPQHPVQRVLLVHMLIHLVLQLV